MRPSSAIYRLKSNAKIKIPLVVALMFCGFPYHQAKAQESAKVYEADVSKPNVRNVLLSALRSQVEWKNNASVAERAEDLFRQSRGQEPAEYEDNLTKRFREHITNADKVLVVENGKGEIVGYARYLYKDRNLDRRDIAKQLVITDIVVHAGHHRKGFAGALLAGVVQLERRPFASVAMPISDFDVVSQRFAESFGFFPYTWLRNDRGAWVIDLKELQGRLPNTELNMYHKQGVPQPLEALVLADTKSFAEIEGEITEDRSESDNRLLETAKNNYLQQKEREKARREAEERRMQEYERQDAIKQAQEEDRRPA